MNEILILARSNRIMFFDILTGELVVSCLVNFAVNVSNHFIGVLDVLDVAVGGPSCTEGATIYCEAEYHC